MAAVIVQSDFQAQENKVSHSFHCFPIYLPIVMGLDAMILVFRMLSFKPGFSLSSFTFINRLFSSLNCEHLQYEIKAFNIQVYKVDFPNLRKTYLSHAIL